MGFFCNHLGGCPREAYEEIGESWFDTCDECPYWESDEGDDEDDVDG